MKNFTLLKKRFNGQAIGSLAQELFVQIINKTSNAKAIDISKLIEKHGREEDVVIDFGRGKSIDNFKYESIDDYFTASLKTASKTAGRQLTVQLTTNYEFRDTLDKYDHDIKEEELIEVLNSEILTSIKNTPLIVFLFNEETSEYGLFGFDFYSLFDDVLYINRRKNRVHITYYLVNNSDNEIAKILYGKNQANAFQRGMWLTYNNLTKKYFIPIINWTKMKEREFDFDFFS